MIFDYDYYYWGFVVLIGVNMNGELIHYRLILKWVIVSYGERIRREGEKEGVPKWHWVEMNKGEFLCM